MLQYASVCPSDRVTLSTLLSLPSGQSDVFLFSVRSPQANERPVFISRDLYWPMRGSWESLGNKALMREAAGVTQEDETCTGHRQGRHFLHRTLCRNDGDNRLSCLKNMLDDGFNLNRGHFKRSRGEQRYKMSPFLLSSALRLVFRCLSWE